MSLPIDSYDSPAAEDLLRAGEQRLARVRVMRRELITNCAGAAGFLLAASLLAALATWHHSFSISTAAIVIVVWVIVERVKFPVAGGWTYPTMLVFVPALFVLPTPIVPLIGLAAIALRRAPDLIRGRVALTMVPAFVADAWFTIGPALVLVVAGSAGFAWSHWPVYVCAFVAQVLFDMGATITWSSVGEGISPRVQLPLLTWVYATDAALWPFGLVIAAAAVNRPGLVLIALSPTAILFFFARERQERLDHTLALSTAYRGTALLLGDLVEADDYYTGMHSRDVVDLSLAVADALALNPGRRRHLEFAALLHDVGKIRVPKEIINKSDSLTAGEWAIIRQHTIEGEKMLKQVGGTLASVGRIVRASHERYDGRGYPDGLLGEEIPIESRIICATDAYSAMTTNRSYRPALSFAEALVELRRCSGSQFDPQVIVAIDNLMTNSAQPLPEASERRLADALTALTMYLHRGSRQHRLLSRRTALGHELGRRA